MKMWLYKVEELPIEINTWERRQYPDWSETPFKPEPEPEPEIDPEVEERKAAELLRAQFERAIKWQQQHSN